MKIMEIETIIELLRNEDKTMENELLKKKYIRELYKILGDPKIEDYGEENFVGAKHFKRQNGWTKDIENYTIEDAFRFNQEYSSRVDRPSQTKIDIADRFEKAGWNVDIQAYNVIVKKIIAHRTIKNLGCLFYESRDCAKYEYVILEEDPVWDN